MRIIILLTLLVFMFACTQEKSTPPNLIPKAKMEIILWQMIQVDQYASNVIAKDSTKNLPEERIKLYSKVFELNKITRETFSNSYKYYLGHPDVSKIMFDSISARASRQRSEAYRPKPIEKPVPKPVN